MPDLERLMRSLAVHMAKDEHAKDILRAEHRGEDGARKQIAVVVLIVAAVAILIYASV